MKIFPKLPLLLLLFTLPTFAHQEDIQETEEFDFAIKSHTYRDNPYPAYLNGFILDEEAAELTLGDGSVWKVESCPPKQLIPEILERWKPGHEIRIETRDPKAFSGKYMLKNVTTKTLLFCSLNNIPTMERANHKIVKIDENGYFMTLEDGSEWWVDWLEAFSTYKWYPGDRVIVNRSGEEWLFINPEQDYCQNAHTNKMKWK